MKNVNPKVLVLAVFDSLFYSTIIIAISILLFSCSKSATLVDQPNIEGGVTLHIDGKNYEYTTSQVQTTVVPNPVWYNMLCTQTNNSASFGFRVGDLYADSVYLLKTQDVVFTFRVGTLTYSNTDGITALHITGKTGNKVKGYFNVPMRNNSTGAKVNATGEFENIMFNK